MKLTTFRWWVFKRLSSIGWAICPEPHKSNLQSVMPQWESPAVRAALGAEEKGNRNV